MALEERIRTLIREETARSAASGTQSVEQMQQQITDLHEHSHVIAGRGSKLEERVKELEATVAALAKGLAGLEASVASESQERPGASRRSSSRRPE